MGKIILDLDSNPASFLTARRRYDFLSMFVQEKAGSFEVLQENFHNETLVESLAVSPRCDFGR